MKKKLLLFLNFCCIGAMAQIAKFEPADGKIYHGVGQGWKGEKEYMGALNDSSIFPLVRHLYFDIPSTRPDKLSNQYATTRGRLDTLKMGGFIPEISIAFVGQGGAAKDTEVAQAHFDSIIDTLATIIQQYGKRVFIRPGFEFNGSWNGYHKYDYVDAFRKIVDRFELNGIADSCAFIWCYEPSAPNNFDTEDSDGAWWYPGDDYVDWFGIDVFDVNHFGSSFPDSSNGNITSKGKTERFLKMAVDKHKPVHISETTAKKIDITADSTDGVNDWNEWFLPFWEFMEIHPEIKGFNYINWDWTKYATWATWGDARIENSPYIVQEYAKEMQKSKYIHLKGPIEDTTSVGVKKIKSNENKVSLFTYPNPVSDYFNLKYTLTDSAPLSIYLYSEIGQKILEIANEFSTTGEHYKSVSTSELPNGIYFLVITSDHFIQRSVIVK